MFTLLTEFEGREIRTDTATNLFAAVQLAKTNVKAVNARGATCTIYEKEIPIITVILSADGDRLVIKGRVLGLLAA